MKIIFKSSFENFQRKSENPNIENAYFRNILFFELSSESLTNCFNYFIDKMEYFSFGMSMQDFNLMRKTHLQASPVNLVMHEVTSQISLT